MKKIILFLACLALFNSSQPTQRLKGAAILGAALYLNHKLTQLYASIDNKVTPVLINRTIPYWSTSQVKEREWQIGLYNWKGDKISITVPMEDQRLTTGNAPHVYNPYTDQVNSMWTLFYTMPSMVLNSFANNQEQLYILEDDKLPSHTYLANYTQYPHIWALKIGDTVVATHVFDRPVKPKMHQFACSFTRAFLGRSMIDAVLSFGGVALKNALSLGTTCGMLYGGYKLLGF